MGPGGRHGAGSGGLEVQPASFLRYYHHLLPPQFPWLLIPPHQLRCGTVLRTQPQKIARGEFWVTPWPLSPGFSQHFHGTWGALASPCGLRDFAGEGCPLGTAGGGRAGTAAHVTSVAVGNGPPIDQLGDGDRREQVCPGGSTVFCSDPTNLRGRPGVALPHVGSGPEMGGDLPHYPQERAPLLC